jgi:hypothetical protein
MPKAKLVTTHGLGFEDAMKRPDCHATAESIAKGPAVRAEAQTRQALIRIPLLFWWC